MIILIDMDDVIETLIEAWVDYLNEKYGTDTKYSDIRNWDISLAFPSLTKEQVYSVELDGTFWDRVKPKPGADRVMRTLLDEGHEIYIVTATYYQTLREKMEKVLFNFFPYITWDHVIITERKNMIKGNVFIDDGPHNLEGGDYHKILFSAYHNLDFDEKSIGAVRADNWDEVYSEVRRITLRHPDVNRDEQQSPDD